MEELSGRCKDSNNLSHPMLQIWFQLKQKVRIIIYYYLKRWVAEVVHFSLTKCNLFLKRERVTNKLQNWNLISQDSILGKSIYDSMRLQTELHVVWMMAKTCWYTDTQTTWPHLTWPPPFYTPFCTKYILWIGTRVELMKQCHLLLLNIKITLPWIGSYCISMFHNFNLNGIWKYG